MQRTKDYILAVGTDGANRLEKLNKLLLSSSHAFFKSAGLKKGQNILEIGCGTGNLTTYIAEEIGPTGHITAIDINEEQILIAKERAKQKNLSNIKFCTYSILEPLPFFDKFDIVYSRLTIMHVSDGMKALQNMYSMVQDGGILACEEASNAHCIHYPFNAAYSKSRSLLLELSQIKNMDPCIGDKLYTYFYQLGLMEINAKFIQPIYSTEEERSIIPQFFNEVKDNYIQHGLITEAEAEVISEEIEKFSRRKDSLISFPTITQIWARKISKETGAKNNIETIEYKIKPTSYLSK